MDSTIKQSLWRHRSHDVGGQAVNVVSARRPRWRLPRQPRRGWIATAVTLATVAALANIYLIRSADHRVSVVRVVRDVPVGKALTQADLGLAVVAVDAGVRTIPGRRIGELVGLHATVGLRQGSLLTASQVTTRLTPQPGQALVTIGIKTSALPPRGLAAGSQVRIVPTSGARDQSGVSEGHGGTGPAGEGAAGPGIPATVDQVGSPDLEGMVAVSLVVADADSGLVAQQGSTGQFMVVVTAQGG